MKVEANPRGIPKAPFMERVEQFTTPESAEETLQKFNEMIGKFKYMQKSLNARKASLNQKIPEIESSCDMVNYIIKKKEMDAADAPMQVQFELAETCWAKASVPLPDHVSLWLGANVMLEYPVAEAAELLNDKLKIAKESLKQADEDLDFLREQITTMEVNIARVYNFDVKNRKEGKVPQKK
ncbi:MAG: hypothetical protein SGCHY_002482 [Lobulomycetales sp.]